MRCQRKVGPRPVARARGADVIFDKRGPNPAEQPRERLGFRGLRLRAFRVKFRVPGLGFGVLGFRIAYVSGFRGCGFWLWVVGFGFRVSGLMFLDLRGFPVSGISDFRMSGIVALGVRFGGIGVLVVGLVLWVWDLGSGWFVVRRNNARGENKQRLPKVNVLPLPKDGHWLNGSAAQRVHRQAAGVLSAFAAKPPGT